MEKMGELDELRARLAALEAEVGRLREESGVARAGRKPARAKRTQVPTTETAPAPAPTPVPTKEAVRVERVEPGRSASSMTGIADAVGVMVSGLSDLSDRAEQRTRVLRTDTPAPESESRTLVRHGRFLEHLLEGREDG
ncbi:hypothetical protein ATKI12_6914 [Kitasatospora sp. Ki12]|uniref:hypothetical protein n=1 Tax=Kitasatospora xanthocidica TaxID=83382 RepID=UPI001677D015|nr:hypothetical protein [Kitasatospora xanthocidica]GHF63119.1 hypothetical protein GCM10018790_46180 [Kitasatospora xanthocidica]